MEAITEKGGLRAQYFEGDKVVVHLIGEIHSSVRKRDEEYGVYTPHLMAMLGQYKDEKFVFNIHSIGGNAFDALAVYDFIRANGIHVTSYLYGLCASAATPFACASRRVHMGESATCLIHNVTQWGSENESTRTLSQIYANIYSKKTGKDAQVLIDLMAENKLITAEQALDIGLVDEIIAPQPIEESIAKYAAIAADYNKNFQETKTHTKMAESKPTLLDKALAFLGLAGKSEDEITAFLDSDENKVVAKSELDSIVAKKLEEFKPEADPKLAEFEATHAQFNSAIDALTDKFVALVARVESIESDQEAVQEIVEEAEEKTADKIKAVAEKINAISIKKPFKEAPKADASAVVETNEGNDDEQPNPGVLAEYEAIKARIDARKK